MVETDMNWPWQYNFPPFFTLQPHPETRSKQVQAWKALILDYCKRCKLYLIDQDVIISLLGELQKLGHAAPVDKAKHRWEIYWHTLEEWASIVYEYISSRGMQGSVVTFYELSQGEDVQGEEFYEIHHDVLIKVLQALEKDRKCELILSDEDQGVKFF
ncbi:vacuolar protein-sorting-associated protein 25 isoform X2 [Euwallacea fornicatus]|uniref:vacuolar protein-sorting-associated protein 25 isoform X2 n=1 Tax=Euwallacea fornicatus TaxID=995702 RepID=UPI0033904D86